MNFDAIYTIHLFPTLIKSLDMTLKLSVLSLIISLVLSIFLALIRQYKVKILYPVCSAYISFFRGTPLLGQLFFIYFGFAQVFPIFKNMNAITATIIALSLNTSAYMAETIRGAIDSVEKGQLEASLSVGMTNLQAMRRIIFPQAARVAIPSLSNSFVDIIKGSSLAFTIGVTELMAKAKMEGAATYKFFECYAAVMIIYWVIISAFGYLQKKLEIKMNEAY